MLSVHNETQNAYKNLAYFKRMNRLFIINKDSCGIYDTSNIPEDALSHLIPNVTDTPFIQNPLKQTSCNTQISINRLKPLLSHMDQYQVEETQKEIKKIKEEIGKNNYNYFVILITQNCNLKCSYCFANVNYTNFPKKTSEGKQSECEMSSLYHNNFKRYDMNKEIADKVIDYLFKSTSGNFGVAFFGGEPMLKFGLIQYMVDCLNKKASLLGRKVTFHLTTNGTIISKEQIDFMKKHQFTLIVSCDGTKTRHNRERRFKKGNKGSYDSVIANIKDYFLPSKLPLTVRATFPIEDFDYDEVGKSFLDLGINTFSIEPADALIDEFPKDKVKNTIDSLERWARTYIKQIKNSYFNFFYFNFLLKSMYFKSLSFTPCGAGSACKAIASDGSIWPCQDLVGNQYGNWRLGSIYSGITDNNLVDQLIHTNVNNRKICNNCWYRLFCGTKCYVPKSFEQFSTFGENYMRPAKFECYFYRELVQITAWIYSELARKYPSTLKKIVST